MLKQMICRSFCTRWVLLGVLVSFSAFAAGGEEGSLIHKLRSECDESRSLSPFQATVTGQMKFERRNLMVIDQLCETPPCARTRSYWSAVLQSGENRYIFRQKLSDSSQAPQSIPLAGHSVSPGSIVKVDADILTRGPQIYTLENVKTVTPLMEKGWSCRTEASADERYSADIWFDSQEASGELFKMSVKNTSENNTGNRPSPVVHLEKVEFTTDSHRLSFEGVDANIHARLEVQGEQTMGQAQPFSATLVITPHSRVVGNASVSGLTDRLSLELTCSQTRE